MRGKRKSVVEQMEWRKQMYELWHQWLQFSKEEDWADSISEGYRAAKAMTFDVWWDKHWRGTYGSGAVEDYAFTPINTVDEFNESNTYPYDEYDFGERIFRIGFSVPKHVLHKRLDQLIDEFHTNHETGHKPEDLSPIAMSVVELVKYPTKRFVTTVRTILKVYKARLKFPKKKLYEIGYEIEEINKNVGSSADDPKQLVAITVSRYLKWADEIKAQLAVGMFPYYNMPKKRGPST